jgi:SM-20-related protein
MATFIAKVGRPAVVTRRIPIGDKEVLVVDGFVSKRTQILLYDTLRRATFGWVARDSAKPEHFHGVRWRMDLPSRAAKLPFFRDVSTLIRDLALEPPVLQRVYANFNLYGEVHFPHEDGPRGITALYCVNPVWPTRWQGETFFFEGSEPSHVVVPRPGRLILFDASITHRGSPPSRDCFEPRINIAFKFGYGVTRGQKRASRHASERETWGVVVPKDLTADLKASKGTP